MSRVGLVVVSHSRALAQAAVELAREMVHGQDVVLEVAAGLDDGALGTDAGAILTALAGADRGDGVVVLMDLGSAVLSAEVALELLEDAARDRVVLCPAPLVEGLVVAAVAAAGGATREAVAAEALQGLAGKQAHLSGPEPLPGSGPAALDGQVGSFTVVNEHGLHARPAARLVQLAAAQSARLEVRNATTASPWVSATSLSRVATLGALRGHQVQVRASGSDARVALEAVLALGARGLDENAPAAAPSSSRSPLPAAPPGEGIGAGEGSGAAGIGPGEGSAGGAVAASPGIAVGPARVLRAAALSVPDGPAAEPEVEWERLVAARQSCREELRLTRARTATQLGEPEAAVFDAHLLLLDDSDLLEDARSRIDAGASAAWAWTAAVDRVQADLAALPDAYLRARAADVRAVGEQVLRLLLGESEQQADLGAGVLVAPDLRPAQAAALDPQRVTGLVLAFGSPAAHSVILARARGVPAVVGAGPAVLDTADGTTIALDGATGELVVDPALDVAARFRDRARQQAAAARKAAELAGAPARTREGVQVLVGANVGSVQDARAAASFGADLAGLVRTEFLFLDRAHAPDVDEQETVYRELAQVLGGRRLTLRTLDVGGDKPLPYLPMPSEANPFLGVRGLRLSLARPGLLADQLLAVVRVAHETPVSVMFPMVSTMVELAAAQALLEAAVSREGRGRPAGLQVGMMVEVPAAALKAAVFAPHVDFLSIGTNDLTQYALAADRGNGAVTGLGDPYDPGVLRLVAAVCAGAGSALVAVCGELAADPRAAGLLVGLGVRELSVAAPAVPGIKQAVRGVDARAVATAARALDAAGPQQVRDLLTAPRD